MSGTTRPVGRGLLAALLLAALAAASLGGRSARSSGDGGPRLVFSHAKHLNGVGLACDTCHPAERRQRVPGEEVCAGCHDATRGGAEPFCPSCHVGTDDATTLKKGESLRRGEGMDPTLWACASRRFEHDFHAELAPCYTCHPRANTSESALDVLYPGRRFQCVLCHEDDPCEGIRPPKPAATPPFEETNDHD